MSPGQLLSMALFLALALYATVHFLFHRNERKKNRRMHAGIWVTVELPPKTPGDAPDRMRFLISLDYWQKNFGGYPYMPLRARSESPLPPSSGKKNPSSPA